jgi:hypothetical protein
MMPCWTRRRRGPRASADNDFTRWKKHDHYNRAFERLLRDLRATPRA